MEPFGSMMGGKMKFNEEELLFLQNAKKDETDEAAARKARMLLFVHDEKPVSEISYEMRISTSYIYQIIGELKDRSLYDVIYKRKGRPVGR